MSKQTKEEALIIDTVRTTRQTVTLLEAKALIRTWLQCVAETVSGGDEVHVAGFGVFYPKTSKPRRIRSVRTGEIVSLPRTRRLGFRAAGAQKWSGA